MEAAGKFVALMFLSRDLAHKAHLAAKGEGSYARHVALGTFYDEIIDLADAFTEQFQGEYDVLLDIPLLDNDDEGDIRAVLNKHKTWIENNRYDVCEKEDTPLQNTIDEIVRLYQTTNYKLKFLK